MVSELIKKAIKENASDIHLSVGNPPVLRINGSLIMLPNNVIFTLENMEEFIKMCMNDNARENYIRDKYYDTSFENEDSRFRIHFYYERGNMACAIRSIPKMIPNFNSLNLPAVIKTFANYKNGLVLVTGMTGSGKSTTLASIINDINNTQNKHIITVEDPIEFTYVNNKCIIHQKEVGHDVSSFSEAVRSAMREDPDIILVGEMRDLETISNALTLAETGHLVFGTLHTKNAAETIDRAIDVFPPSQQQQVKVQLSTTLRAVVGQTLVRGTKGGRVPVCEVMVVNDAIRSIIRDKNSNGGAAAINDAIQTNHKKLGSQNYYQSAVSLIRQGLISFDVASSIVDDVQTLQKLMAMGGA